MAGAAAIALVPAFPAVAFAEDDTFAFSIDYSEFRISDDADSYYLESVLATDLGGSALELKTAASISLDGAASSGEAELKFVQPVSANLSLVAGGLQTIAPGDDVATGFVGVEFPLFTGVGIETLFLLSEHGEVEANAEVSARFDLGWHVAVLPKTKVVFSEAGEHARLGGPHGWESSLRLGYAGRSGILPYVGIIHWRALGDAAREMRLAGEDARSTFGVIGFRAAL